MQQVNSRSSVVATGARPHTQVARMDCFRIEAAARARKDPKFAAEKPSTNGRPDPTVQWMSRIDNRHGELRIAR